MKHMNAIEIYATLKERNLVTYNNNRKQSKNNLKKIFPITKASKEKISKFNKTSV